MGWVHAILILSYLVTCLYAQGLQPYLLFADRDLGRIYRSNLNSSDIQRLVSGLSGPVALDYDYRQDHMFWSDVTARTISRANLDGSGVTVLASSGISVVDGLSVDWVNGKLYWTDATLKHIEVYDMRTGIRKVLIRTGSSTTPRAIVVDPATRWMYWSDWGVVAKIERASMDGRSRQIIHSSQLVWPNGLTLDYQNQVLYWIDGSLDKIESSNVDGTNRRLILSLALSSLNYQGFALSFFNNTLYWSDWGRDMVFSVFANGTSITSLLQGFSVPTGIEVVSENRQQLPPGTNPCASNNGGCSHLCLLSAAATDRYTCACPDNLVLGVRGRNCSGCSSTQFQCTSGQCVSSLLRCNGIRTCSDGSDEMNCVSCQGGAFRCSNGQCISFTNYCNGNQDCTDSSDESGCTSPTSGSTSSNVVGIAVGGTVAGIVLFIVLPIIICVVVGCRIAHASSKHPKTVTTTAQPATVTTTSQQGGFQTNPAPGTDVNQASAHEMSAYPSPAEVANASAPPPQELYPTPQYPYPPQEMYPPPQYPYAPQEAYPTPAYPYPLQATYPHYPPQQA